MVLKYSSMEVLEECWGKVLTYDRGGRGGGSSSNQSGLLYVILESRFLLLETVMKCAGTFTAACSVVNLLRRIPHSAFPVLIPLARSVFVPVCVYLLVLSYSLPSTTCSLPPSPSVSRSPSTRTSRSSCATPCATTWTCSSSSSITAPAT